MNRPAVVAIDLGAGSYRVSLLRFIGSEIEIHLVHRCENRPLSTDEGLVWEIETIFQEAVKGLRKCAALAPEGIASIGVDGWACDYVRLGEDGKTIGRPYCYRDERSVTSMTKVHELISAQRLYELTGCQVQRFNTLYQLYADNLRGIPSTCPWLNFPEYILYRLGGRPVSEYTIATHTQMLEARQRNWCKEIFDASHLSISAAPPVVQPGTDIGLLSGELAELEPYRKTRLIAPACHDTPSAVAGIPAEGDDWAFLISGTWSLVGTVIDQPCTGAEAMAKNYSNQGGLGGTINFLKNVNGMWLLRQCMDHWEQQGTAWSFSGLAEASAALPPPGALLEADDPEFVLPGNMPARINAQLRRKGHAAINEHPAEAPYFANLIFHSLAARDAQVIADISAITGKKFTRLYVVGGGARNQRMLELTQQATGLEIILGSAESSTIGNFAIQLATLESGPCVQGVQAEKVIRWTSILAEKQILEEALRTPSTRENVAVENEVAKQS